MDANTLEFWGNFLLASARARKSVEESAERMRDATESAGEMAAAFRRLYGLDKGKSDPADVYGEFVKSMNGFLDMLGVAPVSTVSALKARVVSLERRLEQREETIRRLESLLKEKETAVEHASRTYAELVTKQADAFTRFMKGFEKAGRSEMKKNG